MKYLGRIVFILLVQLFVIHLNAQCSGVCIPLAYEGFDYNTSDGLNNLTGGTGWASAWEVQNGGTVPPQFAIGGALPSYLDLQTNGNSLEIGTGYASAGRSLDVSTTGPFANYIKSNGRIGEPGTTLWFSALATKTNDNDQPLFIHIHDGYGTWYDGFAGVQRLGVGYYGTDSNSGGNRYWSLDISGTVHQTTIPVTIGQSELIVLSITFDAADNHTINAYINPASIGGAAPSPDWSITLANEPLEFRSFKLYGGCCTPVEAAFDEIRFGDSYQCVTPDAATMVNTPPVANIVTTGTTTGVGPLTVSFDATGSTDADGTIDAYQWNFSWAANPTTPTASYTFEVEGLQTINLTVTDNCGTSHTTSVDINVLDAQGNFSCQSHLRVNNLATHGNADGSIGGSFGFGNQATIYNPDNTSSTQNSITFSGLANNDYSIVVTGSNGCRDSFDVHMPIDSFSIPGWAPNPCNHSMGINLDGIAYWTSIRPFKDFNKYGGEYFTGWNTWGGPWNSGYMDSIDVDVNGYPLELPYFPTNGDPPQLVRGITSANGHMPLGSYVLLYDGDGVIDMWGSTTVTSSSPGRIEFDVTAPENLGYNLVESTLGNHIRNIRIVRPEHEDNYLTEPFFEVFLQRAQPFTTFRFMDWGHTNNSDLVEWSDRILPDYHTQGIDKGIAYEYIIELSNLTKKDLWVCVPHQANNNYITQMARLYRDNVDPNLTIYLEYSNEVWNWQFDQSHYVGENGPNHLSHPRAIAERAKNVFEIWMTEFAGQEDRLKRVFGYQVVNAWAAREAMAQLKGEFDFISPTWYFGYSGSPCEPSLDALGASATPQDVLDCSIQTWRDNVSAPARQGYWDARLYKKQSIEYEGGQHMTSNPFLVSFQQAVYDAQIIPEIYDAYNEVLDSITNWGSVMTCAFTLADPRESVYGSFGALEFIEQDLNAQPSYKYQALIDRVNNCPNNLNCLDSLNIHGLPIVNSGYSANYTINSDGAVNSTGTVYFNSGDNVNLDADFEVPTGGELNINIQDCDQQPFTP